MVSFGAWPSILANFGGIMYEDHVRVDLCLPSLQSVYQCSDTVRYKIHCSDLRAEYAHTQISHVLAIALNKRSKQGSILMYTHLLIQIL